METAAKMCNFRLKTHLCGGGNVAVTNRACYDLCMDRMGYTGGGYCDMKKHNCVCRKTCVAEQTQAHAGIPARAGDADAGDMMSRNMAARAFK